MKLKQGLYGAFGAIIFVIILELISNLAPFSLMYIGIPLFFIILNYTLLYNIIFTTPRNSMVSAIISVVISLIITYLLHNYYPTIFFT